VLTPLVWGISLTNVGCALTRTGHIQRGCQLTRTASSPTPHVSLYPEESHQSNPIPEEDGRGEKGRKDEARGRWGSYPPSGHRGPPARGYISHPRVRREST